MIFRFCHARARARVHEIVSVGGGWGRTKYGGAKNVRKKKKKKGIQSCERGSTAFRLVYLVRPTNGTNSLDTMFASYRLLFFH